MGWNQFDGLLCWCGRNPKKKGGWDTYSHTEGTERDSHRKKIDLPEIANP